MNNIKMVCHNLIGSNYISYHNPSIGKMFINLLQVSTFELILSLKEEKRQLGLVIRNWLSPLTGSKKIHVVSC